MMKFKFMVKNSISLSVDRQIDRLKGTNYIVSQIVKKIDMLIYIGNQEGRFRYVNIIIEKTQDFLKKRITKKTILLKCMFVSVYNCS